MSPAEVEAFLASRLNYERRGMPAGRELRLDRMRRLLAELGDPHLAYPVLHIAGTKGKGTTAALLASLLRLLPGGGRVGLHTSPHFQHLGERMVVDDAIAGRDEIATLLGDTVAAIETVDRTLAPQPGLTFFEITTALALLRFRRAGVAWAVVEVGMGGRLDATNIVEPFACVVTSISRDHTRALGEDLASIAREKAGIFKPGVPVVSGVSNPEARAVIRARADELGCRVAELDAEVRLDVTDRGLAGADFSVETWRRRWPQVTWPLLGRHQPRNAALALATLDLIADAGHPVPDAVATGLATTPIPGRQEILARDPLVLLDVAHNEASSQALAQTLASVGFRHAATGGHPGDGARRVLIFAVSADKDRRKVLEPLLPYFDTIVLTRFLDNPRAVPVETLAEEMPSYPAAHGRDIRTCASPTAAWRLARELTANSHRPLSGDAATVVSSSLGRHEAAICVTGSFFLVAELRSPILAELDRHLIATG